MSSECSGRISFTHSRNASAARAALRVSMCESSGVDTVRYLFPVVSGMIMM